MFRPYRIAASLVALLILSASLVGGCSSRATTTSVEAPTTTPATLKTSGGKNVKTIYIAGGCFWGVEKYIAGVHGVVDAQVGYANGTSKSATYGDGSGYAEAVKVDYDPSVAPLPFLLGLFYDVIDPTSVNRQGNDVGLEYRTAIYFTDAADKPVIEQSLAELQKQLGQPIAIEHGPLANYTRAEDYHQKYLTKNPNGYCHIPRRLFDAAAAARPK